MINLLSPKALELELEECEGDDGSPVNLPNLKELTLSNCSTDVLNMFEKSYEKLKILNLYHLHGIALHIRNFLKHNGSINELNLYINDSSFRIFEDDTLFADLDLRLKSIFISQKSNDELQSLTLRNIEKLLVTQGDRLEVISLINSGNLMLLWRVWNHLKAAKRIYFFSADPFYDYCEESPLVPLEGNENLIELELHSLAPYPLSLDDISPFIKSAIKLKSLAVWNLSKEIVDFIKINSKDLQQVSYISIDDDCKIYLKSKNGFNGKLSFRQYLI